MTTFWKVFVALLAIGIVVSMAMLFAGSQPVGSENLVGKPLPDFAAPLASGSSDADANIYTEAQAEVAGSTAACAVEVPGAFNSCRDLSGRSIVMFWNSTKSECVGEVDELNDYARSSPDVNVVAVAFDQSVESARAFVDTKDWSLPVAIDADGAVAGLYAVAGCPSTFFVRDGQVTGVKLGALSSAQLDAGLAKEAGATN
ncbi:MAG: TlpA family protein disulfide reductase [Thermoleophilaceae bacterium]|nr:TlpA family protein disulfide reductase [Thermoleophilaceae bacterium]